MFKKSKILFIVLALACSAFPAAKILVPESGGSINHPVVQTADQKSQKTGQDTQTAGREPAALSDDAAARSAEASAELQSASADSADKIMTIHFLDVGQADSIFIDFNSYEILIDGGNNGDGPRIADYIKPYVDGNLDLIVATHAHEDHVGGLDDVIAAYQVSQIVYSEETAPTDTFQDFYSAAASEPDCKLVGDSDMTFFMGDGARFKILETGDGYKEPNNNSVVSMIDYKDIEVLLMGDLETSVEKKNLTKFSDIEVLKIGHHGSEAATSQAFLDVVRPEAAVISAGLNNKYKLPGKEVIDRLQSIGSAIYGTFRSGNIIMTTDGVQYDFNTEIQLTLNDVSAPSAYIISRGRIYFPSASASATTMRRGCI